MDVGLALDLPDLRDEVGERDDRDGSRVAQQLLDLAGLVLGVHRDDDAAGAQDAVERHDDLRQVREVDADAVTGFAPCVG